MTKIAGVDEAGRGPLAGPVVAAAVILTPAQRKVLVGLGLDDSKRLPPSRREALFSTMLELGVRWKAQAASAGRIDSMNILNATLWAMRACVLGLDPEAELVVVDGNRPIAGLPVRQKAIPRADQLVPAVSAASVIAKVLRDRVMVQLACLFPQYGFEIHKGYPTKAHREALKEYGPCEIHRISFCRKILS
ncbi:MAG TPA: ribonuclease HII [Synergistales bacterium]|nr:ribonuclease HII [Synergistales bacterium]